jgi:hypothetical protein
MSKNRSVPFLHRLILWIAVPIIYHWLRAAVRLPDMVIELILRAYRVVAYPFVTDPEDLLQCNEMVKIFGEIPEQATAVRRLILEGRPELTKAVIRGMLLHHILTT